MISLRLFCARRIKIYLHHLLVVSILVNNLSCPTPSKFLPGYATDDGTGIEKPRRIMTANRRFYHGDFG